MAYKRVLAAVNVEADDRRVVAAAKRFVSSPATDLTVVSVIKPVAQFFGGMDMSREARFESEMERVAQAEVERICRSAKVPVRCARVEVGDPETRIAEIAERHKCDLIAVGAHDRHGMEYFLGTTAAIVLQTAACDVLGVRGSGAQGRYARVLAAIDGGNGSAPILRRAGELPGPRELRALLVIRPLLAGLGIETKDLDDQWPVDQIEQGLQQRLVSKARAHLEAAGLREIEVEVARGTPSKQIKRAAARLKADLIVIGAGEHVGVGWRIGSTTNNVLHGAPCDTLIVRKHHS